MSLEQTQQPCVLYYDNHLVVVNKPSGMVTHEDGVHDKTLRSWTQEWVKQKFHKPGKAFVVPVHRLDQVTSGIVVFAKTDKALSRLMEAFRERSVRKIYRLVTRKPSVESFEESLWSDWLVREESYSRVVQEGFKQAKLAQMKVHLLEVRQDTAHWEVELLTGRHHQIRVQFASRGLAIMGDERYGAQAVAYRGILLHHTRLELEHPVSKTALVLEAPMPSYWPFSF